MDGSRKLILALGVATVASTAIAVTLALRPVPAGPGAAVLPASRPFGGEVDPVPTDPRAPGGPNAIAARAAAEGGPRTPSVTAGGGPKRSVTSFRLAYDESAGGPSWACIAAAGADAAAHLDEGGTRDGLAEPTVAGACGGAGPDRLEGFVRLASIPSVDARNGATASACEATVSVTLARAGQPVTSRDLRGKRVSGPVPEACLTSLADVEKGFPGGLARPVAGP